MEMLLKHLNKLETKFHSVVLEYAIKTCWLYHFTTVVHKLVKLIAYVYIPSKNLLQYSELNAMQIAGNLAQTHLASLVNKLCVFKDDIILTHTLIYVVSRCQFFTMNFDWSN